MMITINATKREDDCDAAPVGATSKPANVSGRAPKFNKVSNPFADPKTTAKLAGGAVEDPHKLEQRTKQIQFGKNTVGYDNYLAAIPKLVQLSKLISYEGG